MDSKRKKPFSGKQKKEQMRAHRERKERERAEEEEKEYQEEEKKIAALHKHVKEVRSQRAGHEIQSESGSGDGSEESEDSSVSEKEEQNKKDKMFGLKKKADKAAAPSAAAAPPPPAAANISLSSSLPAARESKLRTIFISETKEDVQQRKLEALKPLDRSNPQSVWAMFQGWKTIIPLPKRPQWQAGMSPSDLEKREHQEYQKWMDEIITKFGTERLSLFEANLEVWRQLWRVVERSDVLVVVTDIRVPLFHFPKALYDYIVLEAKKPMVLVLNKADLVSREYINSWKTWFATHFPEIKVTTFSTYPTQEVDASEDLSAAFAVTNANDLPSASQASQLSRSRVDADVNKRKKIKKYVNSQGVLEIINSCLEQCHKPTYESMYEVRQGVGKFAKAQYQHHSAVLKREEDVTKEEKEMSDEDEDEELEAGKKKGKKQHKQPQQQPQKQEPKKEEEQQQQQQQEGAQKQPPKYYDDEEDEEWNEDMDEDEYLEQIMKQYEEVSGREEKKSKKSQKKKELSSDEEEGDGTAAVDEDQGEWSSQKGKFTQKTKKQQFYSMQGQGQNQTQPHHKGHSVTKGRHKQKAMAAAGVPSSSSVGGGNGSRQQQRQFAAAGGAPQRQKGKRREVEGDESESEVTDSGSEDMSENEDNVSIVSSSKSSKEDNEKQDKILQEDGDFITIGMIGHPNVGKSSVINGMMGRKVVSTSRTPGHTKHFQTIFINKHVRLCDCPGLVFPIADCPRQLQVLFGLYPLAQVREPYTAIRYLAERVHVESILKLRLSDIKDDDVTEWTPFSVCAAYASKREYLVANTGRPDTHRGGLEILRDVLDGKIVLAFPPPEDGPMSPLSSSSASK